MTITCNISCSPNLNRIILYHIDIKIQRVRKYIPLVVINYMKCIKLYTTSRFPKLKFLKELHVGYE